MGRGRETPQSYSNGNFHYNGNQNGKQKSHGVSAGKDHARNLSIRNLGVGKQDKLSSFILKILNFREFKAQTNFSTNFHYLFTSDYYTEVN